jgi:pyruvate formate lyase activating enzyme
LRRRHFIQITAAGAGLMLCPGISLAAEDNQPAVIENSSDNFFIKPARFYNKLADGVVECQICPRQCRVEKGERGYCGVRENRDGEYFTMVHSRACAANVDPIEKKPFFHVLPGSMAFSIATAGCNLNCKFCQNWNISQSRPEDVNNIKLTPADCANYAINNKCRSIAYTYSEPTVFYEYMSDCASAGKSADLRSVVVSNGFIRKDPLESLLPLVDAYKIDLKAITEKYYRDVCKGDLNRILDSLINIKSSGKWLEIVYLTVPGLNDSKAEFQKLADWLLPNLGSDVPIHFTRFHPEYLLKNLPMTPLESLELAHNICREKGLRYVYIGNVYGHDAENTYCHNCNKLLIKRQGLQVAQNVLDNGKCPFCQNQIPGIWN